MTRLRVLPRALSGPGWLIALTLTAGRPVPAAPPQEIVFNRDIRPILSENCFPCHGQDAGRRKADLRLDVRESAVEAGAIVPGDPTASALVERVMSEDDSERMPPPKSNRVLTKEQKELLTRWVAQGAKYQAHWAFIPPVRPALPGVTRHGRARNAIDRFVLARLEASGLKPAAEADRGTLIRRLSFDLLGLLPSAGEVEAFVGPGDPDAYEALVERLLESPHFGERLALDWLDAARYADTNGFSIDGGRHIWLWARLGHPGVQRQQALQPVPGRADRRRPLPPPRRTDADLIATGFRAATTW